LTEMQLMGSEKQNLGEIYAARAMATAEPPASSISIPKIREARDMIYSGGTTNDSTKFVNSERTNINKKTVRRLISPFTIILILLSSAVASVLYIGNILAVGRLMAQINNLQIKHQQNISEQELLKAQINRLSGLERIQQIAKDQLGLRNPKNLPVWIEIDQERVKKVEEIIQQQTENKR
jgi:cell division protein FtsL